jgi:peroxiredoxin
MRSPAFVVLLLAVITACSSERQGTADSAATLTSKPDVGFRAPEYSASTLSGDSVSLSSYRGKVVLLNVWATWCGPCRKEIPELRVINSRYSSQGLTVVGVTVDTEGTEAQIADFVKEFRMDYALWHDPNERISAQYAIVGLPASFLIDRSGVIRWKATGPIAPGDTALDRAIGSAIASR